VAGFGIRLALVSGAALTAVACNSYPTEPRYSTRADGATLSTVPSQTLPPDPVGTSGQPAANLTSVPVETPLPATVPIGRIEGGSLPSTTMSAPLARPVERPSVQPPSAAVGLTYFIQPGDTISGVGRRFRTPVQTLIDLNALGPQGAIRSGQTLVLPPDAVDTGPDPFATGPAPSNSTLPQGLPSAAPPATTVPPRPAPDARPPQTVAPISGSPDFQWPVRGEILRRFGPVGLGERNNGINIGAAAGTAVVAAAAGRVAYVGDALPGQGLTVLIIHRDGWRTVYGHLGSATVDDGDDVRAGQQVGTVGLTAGDGRPSVHFETRRMQGDNPTAIDPVSVLPR